MLWDRSLGPPRCPPRHSSATAEIDGPFCAACLAMFYAGLDTADIAARLHESEAAVYTAVRIAREGARIAVQS